MNELPVAYAVPIELLPAVPVLLNDNHRDTARVVPTSDNTSRSPLLSSAHTTTIPSSVREKLSSLDYTHGLIEALWLNHHQAMPLRIVILDNSGSMSTRDGHVLVKSSLWGGGGYKQQACSRWNELQDMVEYQAKLVACVQASTTFQLLNSQPDVLPEFHIAQRGSEYVETDLQVALQTIRHASPTGVTPLLQQLQHVHDTVQALMPSLVQQGTQVAVVIATDGIPTDTWGYSIPHPQLVSALRSLAQLPVWIVVRLCTDEDHIVHYWNNVDQQLEFNLEVLDDWVSEAKEVRQYNPFLNYALPLHRMREMGFYHRVMDLMDERPLHVDELKDLFRLLLGAHAMQHAPDPHIDWEGFVSWIAKLVSEEKKQWNPLRRRLEPWVDMARLHRTYRPRTPLSVHIANAVSLIGWFLQLLLSGVGVVVAVVRWIFKG